MKVKYLLIAAMLLLAFSIPAAAQCPGCAPATISGTVLDSNSQPLGGVLMQLSGNTTRYMTTSSNGQYSFPQTPLGFYVVTPALANYTFNPSLLAFSLLADKPNQNFTGTLGSLTSSPLDTAEFFVRQQYKDLLQREPDEGGLNFWSADLKACTTQSCRNEKRRNIMCAFIASGEYQARFTGASTTICQ